MTPTGPHVLLVEDNDVNAYLATYLLTQRGFVVERACDGQAGLAAARARRPDLILMDLQMPLMDGDRAGAELLANAALREVPIIAVTAWAMAGDRDRALALGFSGYIEKPFDPLTFVDRVVGYLPLRTGFAAP